MTIVGMQVDSYQRLNAVRISPPAVGLVPVCGPNAVGKSSLIGFIAEALGLERSALPIKEGEHGSGGVIDLGDIQIRCDFKRDSGGKAVRKVVVESTERGRLKRPSEVLASLRGRFADPIAFRDMKPADQVRVVLGITGLDNELARLEGIAEGHYERRRDLGRDAERAANAAEALAVEVAQLPPVSDVPLAPLEELTAALEAARLQNEQRAEAEADMARFEATGQTAAEGVAKMKADVERLQERIAKEEDWIVTARERWTAANVIRAATPAVDTAPTLEAINTHQAASDVAARRSVAEEAAQTSLAAAELHGEAEAALTATREEVAVLLGNAKFPVEGMAYEASQKVLLLNGIPFGQASQAEQLKAAAAVAMAGDPPIKVIFAREGSLLDADSQRVLAEAAEAAGFQLWLEIVADTPEGSGFGAGVWIEDGEAVDMAEAIDNAEEARTHPVPPREEATE